jgi:hypothetical protein
MTIDPARCPLCGEANHCQTAAGHPTCWCFEQPVAAHVLARIPLEAQGVACVCKRCAGGTTDEHERRKQAMRWTRR